MIQDRILNYITNWLHYDQDRILNNIFDILSQFESIAEVSCTDIYQNRIFNWI